MFISAIIFSMKKQKYIKPTLKAERVKINFFLGNGRVVDSLHGLINIDVYASSHCCSSCGGCFLAGTRVLMADGSYKSIESIKKGERVLSQDTKSGELKENIVHELLVHKKIENKGYLLINKDLKVTGNHRMWTNNNQWKRADELTVRDMLQDPSGKAIHISTIEQKTVPHVVYNLHLQNSNHNYFADNVLVHNGGPLALSAK
jgi:hypothetical protein